MKENKYNLCEQLLHTIIFKNTQKKRKKQKNNNECRWDKQQIKRLVITDNDNQ